MYQIQVQCTWYKDLNCKNYLTTFIFKIVVVRYLNCVPGTCTAEAVILTYVATCTHIFNLLYYTRYHINAFNTW